MRPRIESRRPPLVRQLSADGNSVVALRSADNQNIELELRTAQPFQALDDQLLLQIGDVRSRISRHPDGQLDRAVFTLDAQSFAAARDGERIVVRYSSNDMRQWEFGPLDKTQLVP